MPLNIRDPLVVGRVVGDVLDESFTRSVDLRVTYGQREARDGFDLRPSQVHNKPRVDLRSPSELIHFVLMALMKVMVDPDAPSPNNHHHREYLHWLVTNIPATTTGTNFGNEIMSYECPMPTLGIHRIVLVLFRQLCRQPVYKQVCRKKFNTRGFAELYDLGLPVAAVFFNCQREAGCGGRKRRASEIYDTSNSER